MTEQIPGWAYGLLVSVLGGGFVLLSTILFRYTDSVSGRFRGVDERMEKQGSQLVEHDKRLTKTETEVVYLKARAR